MMIITSAGCSVLAVMAAAVAAAAAAAVALIQTVVWSVAALISHQHKLAQLIQVQDRSDSRILMMTGLAVVRLRRHPRHHRQLQLRLHILMGETLVLDKIQLLRQPQTLLTL